MYLRYPEEDGYLTPREGIAEYHAYLKAIGKKAMVDHSGSRLVAEHDATHVIFGMDTSLEQEAGLNTQLILGCQYQWRYLRGYAQLPEIEALYEALTKDGGWFLLTKLNWKCLGLKWRIIRRTRCMTNKWPLQFPEEWLDHPVAALRARHGIITLTPQERATGDLLRRSGQY